MKPHWFLRIKPFAQDHPVKGWMAPSTLPNCLNMQVPFSIIGFPLSAWNGRKETRLGIRRLSYYSSSSFANHEPTADQWNSLSLVLSTIKQVLSLSYSQPTRVRTCAIIFQTSTPWQTLLVMNRKRFFFPAESWEDLRILPKVFHVMTNQPAHAHSDPWGSRSTSRAIVLSQVHTAMLWSWCLSYFMASSLNEEG